MNERRDNNDGSIFVDSKTNKIRAMISVNGKRMSSTFTTEAAAKAWIREKQAAMISGVRVDLGDQTVKVFAPYWLALKAKSLKPNVYPSYQLYIERDIIPLLGHKKLSKLTAADINGFLDQLEELGRGDRTMEYTYTVLSIMINHAICERRILHSPLKGVVTPEYEHDEMRCLNQEEIHRLLIAAIGDPLEALWHVAVKTGARQGEILGLTWGAIDFERRTMRIFQQVQYIQGEGFVMTSPKTKASKRTIPLGENTIRILLAHKERQDQHIKFLAERQARFAAKGKRVKKRYWHDQDLVFPTSIGTPIERHNLKRQFLGLLQKAGIERERETVDEDKVRGLLRFHDLRHSAAAAMLANPSLPLIAVSRLLGHARVSITLDVYGHLMGEDKRKAAEYLDESFEPIQVPASVLQTIDAL